LFNLANDPAEKTNVIQENPEVAEKLKTQLAKIIEDGRSR
jgi:arylsulfatase A